MTAHWKPVDQAQAQGPLQGLRVVELAHVLAGPICGLMLADLGADVLKIERPPKGDGQRWDVAAADSIGPYSASFSVLNRNKRSLLLDLKQEHDRTQLIELLSSADVLLHNYRTGALDRLGFGYEAMRERFPNLIYCSISGFGGAGPWSQRGGYDLVAQAMSGIMSFTGPEGSNEPIKCGVPITDIASGILAATGILAALHRRQTTGEGDHVQTSLLEAGVMFTYLQSAITLASGTIPIPLGSAHPLYAPYEVYQASDGWIALGTANEANWLRLVEVIGRPELARNPRFSTTSARVENRKELKTALSQCFAGAPRDTWVERLAEAGVPCGPVLTVPQMLEHSQVQSCGMVVSLHHREFGDSRAIGCPLKFSRAGTALPKPAPLLNEN